MEVITDVVCEKLATNTLRAKLSFGVGVMAGGRDFQFSIAGVRNPRSAAPTSSFYDISIRDGDSYPIASYLRDDVLVQMRHPAIVQSASLT